MKIQIWSLGALVFALAAGSNAFADARVNVDINPFGWGAPPPLVYESPRYYGPPPLVYHGRGHWGDRRGGHDRDHGRSDHHRDGDRPR
jgi:hypothetical protein